MVASVDHFFCKAWYFQSIRFARQWCYST
uniref:Uncharacterized protein n=1 Tax=Rhizophora mucronata TaxID=61149 RepID=A0A2P2L4V4_RHIMU